MQCSKPHIIYDKTSHKHIEVPCGVCMACRLNYTREWAVRVMNESLSYPCNCFITLTYDDEHLPSDFSVSKSAVQKFFKRLRKVVSKDLKYFACGEYGGRFGRPHYHSIILNWYPEDAYLWRDGLKKSYRSPLLEKCWKFGHSEIGDVTFNSARYVASYIVKQKRGKEKTYYKEHSIEPEFVLMSKGLGKNFVKKHFSQLKSLGYLPFNGIKMKLPRYYENILYSTDSDKIERRKIKNDYLESSRKKFEDGINKLSFQQFKERFKHDTGHDVRFKDYVGYRMLQTRQERERRLKEMIERSSKK